MKVYVHDDQTNGTIVRLCLEKDVNILTPEMVQQRNVLPEGYIFFLDQVDALILNITNPTQDVHFILAQAVLSQKPTLCVYGKNQPPRELLAYVRKRKGQRSIKTFSFSMNTLPNAVHQFIMAANPDRKKGDDEPTVKFTLRLSPRMVQWMTKTSKEQKTKKADFIRTLIQREMEKEYSDEIDDSATLQVATQVEEDHAQADQADRVEPVGRGGQAASASQGVATDSEGHAGKNDGDSAPSVDK